LCLSQARSLRTVPVTNTAFCAHAACALPRVQRRPLTLRALGLEEPFPFRPTSDVLCRHTGTATAAPTTAPATSRGSTSSEPGSVPASSRSLDRCDQDCASAPRVRGNAALSPERLESYRSQLMTQSAVRTSLWRCHPSQGVRTPFRSAISARPRQEPLGPHQARSDPDSLPCGFEPSLTRDASGQLMHPTLSKTSTRAPCSYRLTQGLSMRPHASRRWPRFGRLTHRRA
jgi:hypothetical protein